MVWTKLSEHADLDLLIFRIGFGLGMLVFHGWRKLVDEPDVCIRPRIHIIADSQALYTQYLQRIAQQKTGLSYGY